MILKQDLPETGGSPRTFSNIPWSCSWAGPNPQHRGAAKKPHLGSFISSPRLSPLNYILLWLPPFSCSPLCPAARQRYQLCKADREWTNLQNKSLIYKLSSSPPHLFPTRQGEAAGILPFAYRQGLTTWVNDDKEIPSGSKAYRSHYIIQPGLLCIKGWMTAALHQLYPRRPIQKGGWEVVCTLFHKPVHSVYQ